MGGDAGPAARAAGGSRPTGARHRVRHLRRAAPGHRRAPARQRDSAQSGRRHARGRRHPRRSQRDDPRHRHRQAAHLFGARPRRCLRGRSGRVCGRRRRRADGHRRAHRALRRVRAARPRTDGGGAERRAGHPARRRPSQGLSPRVRAEGSRALDRGEWSPHPPLPRPGALP